MPHSMTAFARCAHQNVWGSLTWEIRSVNHRYLETTFRMPDTLREVEMALREISRSVLNRGKIDCSLRLVLNSEQEGIDVNAAKAQQYLQATDKIAALMSNPAPISPIEILQWPGVIEQREVDTAQLNKETIALFKVSMQQLIESRCVEGAKLKDFILKRVEAIRKEMAKIRAILPTVLDNQKQKLNDKISDLQLTLDPDRLEQEIVILAQKADVDEELDRLDAHLEEIERVLNSKGAIGRRLDFLMQELNREANTLSSKSIATNTTQSAVELKVLIEQMREQIQNIE